MNILIVNQHFDIGGVETFLMRIIPRFNAIGINVTLLLLENKTDQKMIGALDGHCKVVYLKDLFPFFERKIKSVLGENIDLAVYTLSTPLVIGSWILNRGNYNSTKTLAIPMQTKTFCTPTNFWRIHRKLVHHIIGDRLQDEDVVFGNNVGRQTHSEFLKRPFSKSPIVHLFVDIHKYSYNPDVTKSNVIVSVGRLENLKTYNFTFFETLRELRNANVNIEWHIYGDGSALSRIERLIHENDMADVVKLMGRCDYDKLPEAFRSGFIFLGTGSTLIEASACGLPSLIGIEYDTLPETYGYIHEVPGFEMIEPGLNLQKFTFFEKILQVINMDDQEYRALKEKCCQKAVEYAAAGAENEYKKIFEARARNGTVVHLPTYMMMGYVLSRTVEYLFYKIMELRHLIRMG